MHLLHPAALTLSWLLALLWIAKAIETAIGLPKVPNLADPAHDLTPSGNPSLTVIVPARNEAPNIAACLESLLAQDYPHLSILAIDDRSTDATGTLMDALAAAHPTRLTALHVLELPPNWLGKTHAMALAARTAIASATPPDFLLFTDADVLFAPAILRRTLAAAVALRADHFVTMPTTLSKSPGESILLTFLHIMGLWAARPWRVADPHARDAIGVGAFNLLRTSTYLQLGGFEHLRHGDPRRPHPRPQRQARRPPPAPRHRPRHGRRPLGRRSLRPPPRHDQEPLRPLLLPRLAAAGRDRRNRRPLPRAVPSARHPGLRLPGLLALAAIAVMGLLSGRHSSISPWYILAFPLSAALFLYSMLRSMAVTLAHGGVTWRGTFYPLAELRKSVALNQSALR